MKYTKLITKQYTLPVTKKKMFYRYMKGMPDCVIATAQLMASSYKVACKSSLITV
jgi:hypothetical protein